MMFAAANGAVARSRPNRQWSTRHSANLVLHPRCRASRRALCRLLLLLATPSQLHLQPDCHTDAIMVGNAYINARDARQEPTLCTTVADMYITAGRAALMESVPLVCTRRRGRERASIGALRALMHSVECTVNITCPRSRQEEGKFLSTA